SPASRQKGELPINRMWKVKRPIDVHDLHPFGCLAYPLIPKKKQKGKFADCARRCILIGYAWSK
ncbi:hypothetical protein K523DRAFT_221676, partial [Schizophyllum commune Tattone D]